MGGDGGFGQGEDQPHFYAGGSESDTARNLDAHVAKSHSSRAGDEIRSRNVGCSRHLNKAVAEIQGMWSRRGRTGKLMQLRCLHITVDNTGVVAMGSEACGTVVPAYDSLYCKIRGQCFRCQGLVSN
ncbi:hypothetical protein PM082_004572 [Marasmius tenuissimus]|nr:hypothetical protein PM082_004572 [Marasmius tenuissimus]